MSRHTLRLRLVGALVCALLSESGALAEDGTPPTLSPPDLVKQANAPISSVLQVRLQDSYAPHFTGVSGQGNTFTIGLTMPLPEYRLLPFPQLSLLTIPAAITVPGGMTGFGDLHFVDIVVLNAGHRVLWGVGPTFTFPTATDPLLGNGMYSAGPALVGLTMQGHWVVGALANNQWSYAGWGSKSVNAFLIQPFINYNFGHGWYVTTSPIMTANWKAPHDNMWVVPVGGGFGKVQKFGKLPVNIQLSAYYNAVTPKDFGADWQLRFQFVFMFPK